MRRLTSREWVAVTAILLLAAALRLARLAAFPPGAIHDEVWNWFIDQSVLQGDIRPIYDVGGGREGLYFLAQAFAVRLMGDHLLAMRLPSVLASLGLVAVTYSLGRRWLGRVGGVTAMMLVTLSVWAILFGRLAVRSESMPFVAALAFYWLDRTLRDPAATGVRAGLAAGVLLGLTWYTYPSAWGLPFVIGPMLLYLLMFDRNRLRERRRALALTVGLWVAAGVLLFAYIGSNPTTSTRAAQLSEPLKNLLAGHPGRVLTNIPLVLQMFTIVGDPELEYNVRGRPIFPEPLTAGLFYLGLGVAIWRMVRRGRDERLPYLLLLLWWIAGLAPAFLTDDPLDTPRMIGLLGPVFLVAGLGAQAVWNSLTTRWGVRGARFVAGALGIAFALNLYLTVRDFEAWNANPVVRFLYQSDLYDVARALDSSPDTTPVAIAGLTSDTIDPASMRIFLSRNDLSLRFFGWANEVDPLVHGLVLPTGDHIRVYAPKYVALLPELMEFLDAGGQRVETDSFLLWRGFSPVQVSNGGEPLARSRLVDLMAVKWLGPAQGAAQQGLVQTLWQAHAPSDHDLRIFVHLFNPAGELVAQYDGLQVAATQWTAGDRIVHWHVLRLPGPLPGGTYTLRVGLYRPPDGPRLLLEDGRDLVELPVTISESSFPNPGGN